MDIWAINGKFSVTMGFMSDRFQSDWNKDGTLAVRSKEKATHPISVMTYRGDFVEAIDEAGDVVASGGDGHSLYIHLTQKPVTLRFKKFAPLNLTASQLNKARQTVRRYLVSDSPYSLGVPGTLPKAIAWLEKKLAEIPEASRKKSRLDLSNSYSHGESYSNVEITYDEPETDAEVIKRLQIDAERAARTEATERATLDALQKKFSA